LNLFQWVFELESIARFLPLLFIVSMAVDWKTQLAELQNQLNDRLNHRPPTAPTPTPIRFVAGFDGTVKEDVMVGCFVVVDLERDCQPVYEKCTVVDVVIPYVPGLLCFREGSVVTECYRDRGYEKSECARVAVYALRYTVSMTVLKIQKAHKTPFTVRHPSRASGH
jgi:hypothetical protein